VVWRGMKHTADLEGLAITNYVALLEDGP